MPRNSKEYSRTWRERNPEGNAKHKREYQNKHENKNRARARTLWTNAEMAALAEWKGTAREFAEKYERSILAVERKKFQLGIKKGS